MFFEVGVDVCEVVEIGVLVGIEMGVKSQLRIEVGTGKTLQKVVYDFVRE